MDNHQLSITCSRCGAPMSPVANKDYFVCGYCGGYYFPQASQDGVKMLGETGTLSCPVCKIPLVTAMIEDIHIQACSKCQGVMVYQNQLLFIVQSLRLTSKKIEQILPVEKDDLNHVRYCQTCGKKLDTHIYEGGGNVVIDVCGHCETVWFDYGELHRIITAPDFGIHAWE